jgi:hypothetical protein
MEGGLLMEVAEGELKVAEGELEVLDVKVWEVLQTEVMVLGVLV